MSVGELFFCNTKVGTKIAKLFFVGFVKNFVIFVFQKIQGVFSPFKNSTFSIVWKFCPPSWLL